MKGYELKNIQIHGYPLKVGKPRVANSTYSNVITKAQSGMPLMSLLKGPDGAETVQQHLGQLGPNIQPEMPFNTDLVRTAPFRERAKTVSKLIISNIPEDATLEQIRNIVEVIGKIKEIEKVNDSDGKFTGQCSLIYDSEELTKLAQKRLIGIKILDNPINVKRITTSETEENVLEEQKMKLEHSTCLRLNNLIRLEDMRDDLDFDDVAEDTEDEMKKYGTVIRTVVPKPKRGEKTGKGVGLVFVKFEKPAGAQIAKQKMSGRLFDGRRVEADFYEEEKFENEVFE